MWVWSSLAPFKPESGAATSFQAIKQAEAFGLGMDLPSVAWHEVCTRFGCAGSSSFFALGILSVKTGPRSRNNMFKAFSFFNDVHVQEIEGSTNFALRGFMKSVARVFVNICFSASWLGAQGQGRVY